MIRERFIIQGLSYEPVGVATVRFDIGRDHLRTVSGNMVRNPATALDEFLANAYDADATNASINVNLRRDTAEISDNGTGMTPEELVSFFRVGDSDKLHTPISPVHNRVRIGKFGMATLLLPSLGQHVRVTSTKDGIESTVDLEFDGEFSHETEFNVRTKPVKKTPSGTQISIGKLNHNMWDGIHLTEYALEIPWKLPISESFTIDLNGKPVDDRPVPKGSTFIVRERGERAGLVEGTLHYFVAPHKYPSGIHLYVHGRRVENPAHVLGNVSGHLSLRKRVVGIINVDEFNPDILFDRENLRHNRAYTELMSILRTSMRDVRNYADWDRANREASRESFEKQRASRGQRVGQIRRWGHERAVNEALVSGVIDKKTVVTYPSSSQDRSVIFARHGNTAQLIIDRQHPQFLVSPDTSTDGLAERVLSEIITVVALKRSRSIKEYEAEKERLWRRVSVRRDEGEEEYVPIEPETRLFQSLLYTPANLATASGVPEETITYLIRGGVLETDVRGKIAGQTLTRLQHTIRGLSPLIDLIEYESRGSQGQSMRRLNDLFKEHVEKLDPLLVDYSTNGTPCFFVDDLVRDLVADTIVRSDSSSDTGLVSDLIGLNHRIVSSKKLHSLLNLTNSEALELMAHARRYKTLVSKEEGYVIGNLVAAGQSIRGNPRPEYRTF